MTTVIILIPAADQEAANQAALNFDPEGGQATFTVPLASAEGGSPTHYWCAGPLSGEHIAVFQATIPSAVVAHWDMDADPPLPDTLLADRNLKRFTPPDGGSE